MRERREVYGRNALTPTTSRVLSDRTPDIGYVIILPTSGKWDGVAFESSNLDIQGRLAFLTVGWG